MFKSKDTSRPDNVDTLIGANTIVEGNIQSQGIIRVDGKLKGDLSVNGDVYVGTNAVVNGNIHASNVYLSGTVEGNIRATGILRILSTARLYGDIEVHSFVADEGGLFQGKCCMIDVVPDEPRPADKPVSKKNSSGRDYKKSSVLDQIYEEKEKNNELKD